MRSLSLALALVLWASLPAGVPAASSETAMTLMIGPGRRECFYETAVRGDSLTAEFQVGSQRRCLN